MNNLQPDRTDMLEHLGPFDPEWYLARYPDVAELEMSAGAHFAEIGHRIGRGISADCPSTGRYPEISAALARNPAISYCIPIMDRLDDLKATLASNLDENRETEAQVEFIVVCFEDDGETATWLRNGFADDLRSGYLRQISMPRLPIWHFGRAKNAFRGRLAGRFYSSLDGDNFVSGAETRQLLSVINTRGEAFVFHHFSGQWGDGSSGRVSLPARYYNAVGYDEHFLPRQFDEVDLIFSTLIAQPRLSFYCYPTEFSILDADSVRSFVNSLGQKPVVSTYPVPKRAGPINPRAEDYAARDAATAAMQGFNEALSFLKNAPGSTRRGEWVGRLRRSAQTWVEETDAGIVKSTLFGDVEFPDRPPGEIACFVPGARVALQEGQPKLIVDARAEPLPQGLLDSGDFVLHPLAGHALVADVLWRAAVAKILGLENALTEA